MENRKFVKFLAPAVLVGVFLIPQNIFAYGVDTHAALTENIFDFYNQNFPNQIIPEELKNYLVDGARREDDLPRWMNHFYDPVYDRGLESIYGNGYRSKEWAVDADKQNEPKYKITTAFASILNAVQQKSLGALTTETDFTWRRAIYFYVNGDEEKAMFLLGHILHLNEDASVPDHTRNDAHPGWGEDYSPYENYAKQPEVYNADLLKNLQNRQPIILSELKNYFNDVANYSNNNFYSKGTIGLGKYKSPDPEYFVLDGKYEFAIRIDKNFGEYKLALQEPSAFSHIVSSKILIEGTKEGGDEVLKDYWRLLSAKSIQHGAGVINLFFEEVEKAKNDPSFAEQKRKSFLARVIDAVKNLFSGEENGVTIKEITISEEELAAKVERTIEETKTETTANVEATAEKVAQQIVKEITNDVIEEATVAETAVEVVFPININTASLEELQKITGIKQAKAQLIIDYRNANGLFYYIEDIKKVSGIGDATFEKMKDQITVGNVTPPSGGGSGSQTNLSQPTNNDSNQQQDNEQNQNEATSTQQQAMKILISEVQITGGPGKTTNDFIELHNPNSSAVNLKGYRLVKRTQSGSSDTGIKSWTDDALISAGGYYLWANSGYVDISVSPDVTTSGSMASDNGIALRFGPADTGEIIDSVGWGNALNVFVENIPAQEPGAMQSIQRKWDGGLFADIDNNSADFELRDCPSPKAQEATCVPETEASYNPETMTINLAWDASGGEGASYYAVYTFNSPSVLVATTTEISYVYPVYEIGRDYNFEIRAVDEEGTEKIAGSAQINVPSFLDAIYFFPDTRTESDTDNLIELRFSDYPFVPDIFGELRDKWKLAIFSLNRDAYNIGSINNPQGWFPPEGDNKILNVSYPRCGSGSSSAGPILILPDSGSGCGDGGGVTNSALSSWQLQIPVIRLNVNLPEGESLSPADYLTASFYDFSDSGPSNRQAFSLVAVDNTKIFFQEELPPQAKPTKPEITELLFGDLTANLSFNWNKSTDSDTFDWLIRYQSNYSASSEFLDDAWTEVGGKIVEQGNDYLIGLRAIDDFGNVSDTATSTWSFPSDFIQYSVSSQLDNASQDFVPQKSGNLSSIQVSIADFQTNSRNRNSNICYLGLYELVDGSAPKLIANNDLTNPADGESEVYAYRGSGCADSLTFSYDNALNPLLEAGKTYRWTFSIKSSGKVRFFGTDTNSAGGLFSDSSLINAKFMVRDTANEIILESP